MLPHTTLITKLAANYECHALRIRLKAFVMCDAKSSIPFPILKYNPITIDILKGFTNNVPVSVVG
ncbi:hypothetical protein ACQZVH_004362 [Vibrio parahaemolyticus]